MTKDQLIASIWQEAAETGNVSHVAMRLNVSPQFLYLVLAGKKKPSKRILEGLGLREVVTRTYERVSSAQSPR